MWRQSGLILQNIKRPEEKSSDHEWMRIRLYFFRRAILFRFLMRERHSSCTSTTHTDCSGAWAGTNIRTISAAEGSVPGRSERLSFRPFVVSAFCPYRRQPLPTPVPTETTGAAGLPGPSAGGLNSSPAPLLVLI